MPLFWLAKSGGLRRPRHMSSKPHILGVLPARWGSTRFPGKMLHPIGGRPLILRVLDRVRMARTLHEVCVATDDRRIEDAVRAEGGTAVLTRPDHPSGTDRIAEALTGRAADIVINIQGDEPLIEPELIDRLARTLAEDPTWDMATAATPIRSPEEAANPNVVKVVWAEDHRALYFSRARIPHVRDADEAPAYWRHIGLYAYQRAFLDRMVRTPPCELERAEKLEQLRALHMGVRMRVIETQHFGIGVDTPEDVAAVEAVLKAEGRM